MDIEQVEKYEFTSQDIANSSPKTIEDQAELYDNIDELDDIDISNISDQKPQDKTHKTT